jgi:hypothetical protein
VQVGRVDSEFAEVADDEGLLSRKVAEDSAFCDSANRFRSTAFLALLHNMPFASSNVSSGGANIHQY